MAAIQPKNTNTIHVDRINEKTALAAVNIQNGIYVDGSGIRPVFAGMDIGAATSAATHFRELFAKELTSTGQVLDVGTDSAHALNLKTNILTRFSVTSGGDLAQDATSGGSITFTKASTTVVPGLASTALTAAGTTISDALALTATFNHITTAAASTGVKLWDSPLSAQLVIVNSGANAIVVYPHSGSGTINGGAGGAGVSLATNSFTICVRVSSTNWICREIVSAAA